MSKRILTLGLTSASLLVILACGGGDTAPPPTPPPATATSIAYTNPTPPSGPGDSFYLNKNTALSTGTHLVLDLCGAPTTVNAGGVVLTLNLDTTKATWANVSGNTPVANGSIFAAPIVQGKITGSTLQVVVTEKGYATSKPLVNPHPILRIALDLKTGLAVGTTIAITRDPDLTKSQVILSNGTIISMPEVKIGTATAQ